MFCKKCGKEIAEGISFCPYCGETTGNGMSQVSGVFYVKPKLAGSGVSTAGMVLGIIAVSWLILSIIGLTSPEAQLSLSVYSYRGELVAFAFGAILIPGILSLIGLPLSISGLVKKKTGKNITGLILNSISLITCIILFIYIVTAY